LPGGAFGGLEVVPEVIGGLAVLGPVEDVALAGPGIDPGYLEFRRQAVGGMVWLELLPLFLAASMCSNSL